MTTKLQLYNLALAKMKASALVAVTDRSEARRALDTHYDHVLQYMLEAGFWKFAMRTVSITQDTSVTPSFGYSQAFNMPSDWVRTYDVSASQDFNPPLEDWIEESNLFFAHSGPLYVRYVSNSSSGYGLDLSRWTARFITAVAYELAARSAPKATGSSDSFTEKLEKDAVAALSNAKNFEALREPSKRLPQGAWNTGRFASRFGGYRGR